MSRLPALARLLPSAWSLLVGLALLAAGAGLYVAARETSMFAVRDVRVKGATPALAEEIRQQLAPVLGQSLVRLDGGQVLSRVESIPTVRTAGYDRAFPHGLVLTVARERPAAVLRRGAESWLLSPRARVLARVAQGSYHRLPRIWAPKAVAVELGGTVGDTDVRRAALALGPLRTEGLPVRVRTVREREGELAFMLADGVELRLGDLSQLGVKLAAAGKILPLLVAPAGGGPTYLDVSEPGRAVVGRHPQLAGIG